MSHSVNVLKQLLHMRKREDILALVSVLLIVAGWATLCINRDTIFPVTYAAGADSMPPLTTWRKYHKEIIDCQRKQPTRELTKACKALQAADDADLAAVTQWRHERILRAAAELEGGEQ